MDTHKRKEMYHCRDCGYKSDRYFNVERHAKRIHSKSITKKCCNIPFFTKSDYYHHIEDHHPNMRSSCFVSKHKYKIYGRKMSTDFCYKKSATNTVNSSDMSDERVAMRRSMRIQEQVVTKEKLSLKETSTESECDDYDDDDNDIDMDYYIYNESEELTHDLHNHQKINSLSSVSEDYENSRCEKSENSDNSVERYQKYHLNTVSRLPLKKRILCEINNNVDNSSMVKNREMKINKVSLSGKENQNLINIYLNEYQSGTIVKQILTDGQSTQMWNNITQCQRNYLKYIDFDSF